MARISAAHQAVIDVKNAAQRELLAYHHIMMAMVTGPGAWGDLQRVGSAYERGNSWTWQLAFSPRLRDAVILETFDSAVNGGKSIRCYFLDDLRSDYAGRSFDSNTTEAKIQQLYFRAMELQRVEWNRETAAAAA